MKSLKNALKKLKKLSDERAMKDFMMVFGEPVEPLSPETAAELETMIEKKRKELNFKK